MNNPRHTPTVVIDDFKTDLVVAHKRQKPKRVMVRATMDARTRRVIAVSPSHV